MLISAQFRGAISGVVAWATTPNKCVSGTGVEGLARLSPLPKPCATALTRAAVLSDAVSSRSA
jgi:hypothetical protein